MNATELIEDTAQTDPRLPYCLNSHLRKKPQKLTPELIVSLREDLPDEYRANCFFAFDGASYTYVMGDQDLFASLNRPSTRDELLRTGRVASVFGMDIFTDAYLHPDRKILPARRVYVVSADGSYGVACDIV